MRGVAGAVVAMVVALGVAGCGDDAAVDDEAQTPEVVELDGVTVGEAEAGSWSGNPPDLFAFDASDPDDVRQAGLEQSPATRRALPGRVLGALAVDLAHDPDVYPQPGWPGRTSIAFDWPDEWPDDVRPVVWLYDNESSGYWRRQPATVVGVGTERRVETTLLGWQVEHGGGVALTRPRAG